MYVNAFITKEKEKEKVEFTFYFGETLSNDVKSVTLYLNVPHSTKNSSSSYPAFKNMFFSK